MIGWKLINLRSLYQRDAVGSFIDAQLNSQGIITIDLNIKQPNIPSRVITSSFEVSSKKLMGVHELLPNESNGGLISKTLFITDKPSVAYFLIKYYGLITPRFTVVVYKEGMRNSIDKDFSDILLW